MKTYGIELEVSSLGIGSAQQRLNASGLNWQVKADGTAYVSAEAVSPILTDERLNECKTAARALLQGGATVNRQTGYHVHLGADEYGFNGIANLVLNWNHAHATIGALVAPSRLNNHFCRVLGEEHREAQAEAVRAGNMRNINGTRYNSLNLNSYERHGTIEFRLHHGTLNGSKIKAWAQFCEAMASYSKAGNLLELNHWADADNRLNNIASLLDILTAGNFLALETGEYLKNRAQELAAR